MFVITGAISGWSGPRSVAMFSRTLIVSRLAIVKSPVIHSLPITSLNACGLLRARDCKSSTAQLSSSVRPSRTQSNSSMAGNTSGVTAGVGVGVEVAVGVGVGCGLGVGGGVAAAAGDGVAAAAAGDGSVVAAGGGVVAAAGDGFATAAGLSPGATAMGSPSSVSIAATKPAATVIAAIPNRPAPTHTRGFKVASPAGTPSAPRTRRRVLSSRGSHLASCWRLSKSSFESMLAMCVLTVSGLRPRRTAISTLVPPLRSSSNTRCSAGVRMPRYRGRPPRSGSMCLILAHGWGRFPHPNGVRGVRRVPAADGHLAASGTLAQARQRRGSGMTAEPNDDRCRAATTRSYPAPGGGRT